MTADQLVLGFADDGVACGMFRGVCVLVWRGAPTPERLARVMTDVDVLGGDDHPELALIGVIEENAPPPGPQEILASARAYDARPRLTHTVAVLEGGGPWLSMALDGVSLVSAQRSRAGRTKFCADLREGATWIAHRHPHGGDALAFREELLRAIEEVRAQLDHHAREGADLAAARSASALT